MRRSGLPIIAVATSISVATPCLAQDVLDIRPLSPPTAAEADVTNPGFVYVQPNGASVYDCQLDEKRTRLQRRNCGPLKNVYGD